MKKFIILLIATIAMSLPAQARTRDNFNYTTPLFFMYNGVAYNLLSAEKIKCPTYGGSESCDEFEEALHRCLHGIKFTDYKSYTDYKSVCINK